MSFLWVSAVFVTGGTHRSRLCPVVWAREPCTGSVGGPLSVRRGSGDLLLDVLAGFAADRLDDRAQPHPPLFPGTAVADVDLLLHA